MSTSTKAPISERINARMVVFWGVILALVGFPVYVYVDSVVSGGIKDRGEYLEVDLRAMSSFPFSAETGSLEDVPQRWRSLDGQRVLLIGEMWAPNTTARELSEFELVYSIADCCFSGPPQIQHFVQSRVTNGRVGFYRGLVRVLGTLRVDVVYEGGQVIGVYHLDVESVEPV